MTCIDCGRTIVGRLIVVCPDCVQVRREDPGATRTLVKPYPDFPCAFEWVDEGETIIGTFGPAPDLGLGKRGEPSIIIDDPAPRR